MKAIIGINAFHGDSSACLIQDNKLIFATEEERLNRIKHWAGFPSKSVELCLNKINSEIKDVLLAFNFNIYSNRLNKASYLILNPSQFKKIFRSTKRLNSIYDYIDRLKTKYPNFNFSVKFVEHHKSHINSAYFLSHFTDSAFISLDGFGDFLSCKWGYIKSNKFFIKGKTAFPHSLGILYQSITQFLGFNNYGDEYKVMGLAPYGKNNYEEAFNHLVSYKFPCTFKLNLKYFRHHDINFKYSWNNQEPKIEKLYSDKINEILGKPRNPNDQLEQKHKDIACSLQTIFEKIIKLMFQDIQKITGYKNICFSGGCAMNSVLNGNLHSMGNFEIFVPPAAGDAGGAIGSALEYVNINHLQYIDNNFKNPYLGLNYKNENLKEFISSKLSRNKTSNLSFHEVNFDYIYETISKELSNGKVIGWFQDAYEWGPRALGNRSILMDPRNKFAKETLNQKIKRRESFRPFAPSILEEYVGDWFENNISSPYMSYVIRFKSDKKHLIPAVCHVDGTGRLQTVSKLFNYKYYNLIKKFYEITNIPMILNTSFNENEPIVNHPTEAIDCFLRTKMDILVIDKYIIKRTD